ncbi:TPA: hypothetical protein SMI77_004888 [Serratia marcescens]|nr:hypothetical protein [Serratia marcescens]
MMDNKLSELSKPVAQIYYDEHDSSVMRIGWFRSDEPKNPEPLYSQEYVSALKHESAVNSEAAASLNVENQELKKRITELERANQSQDDHINQQQDRIDSLEKTNAGLGQRLGAAEKRLATPVRLKKVDSSNVPFAGDGFNAAVDYCADRVRAAGFTVEGDA